MASGGDKPFLPSEIIVNILKRLPLKSIVHFQRVCKHWKNLIKTRHFIAEHARHSAHENPLLLFLENNYDGRRPYLRLLNHKMETVEVLSIPSVDCFRHDWRIIGSCNGLLCVELDVDIESSHRLLCVWNPMIREVRQIPQPTRNDFSGSCQFGFGFSSIISDFKIVKFYNHKLLKKNNKEKIALVGAEVCSLSSGLWKELEFGVLQHTKISSEAVSVDETILWVGVQDSSPVLVSFNIATEVFTLTPIPITFERHRHYHHHRTKITLGVYQNKFSIVQHCSDESYNFFDIWVMEEVAGESGKSFSCIEKYETGRIQYLFHMVCIWMNELVFRDNEINWDGDLVFHVEVLNLTTKEWKEFPNYSSEYYFCDGFNYERSLVSVWNTQVDY